jgi:ABC-type glycerol-3-phosphate transport system substrate-binding protein
MYHAPNAVAIPRTTSDADAAWQLLSFLKSPDLEKVMVQGEGFMPL